jgi:hypothetical protein
MRILILTLPLLALSAAGCDTVDSHTARQAQTELLGMRKAELYACAGLPDKSQMVDGAEYDTFVFQPYTPDNSFSATLPLIGGIGIGSAGSCKATAIFQEDTLRALNYAGDTGGILGHVAECVSIVSHCLNGAKEATGNY